MKKVAVLMSHYNGDKFIKEQIDSILSQKVSDIVVDLFVRDDGSPDSDLSILKKYQEQGKLKLFVEENIGVKYAFFRLLELVPDYDYYFFADQDDVWVDNKIQVMVDELEKMPNSKPVGVYSNLYIADKNAKETGKLLKGKKILPYDSKSTFNHMLMMYFVTGASFGFNKIARDVSVKYYKKILANTTMLHDAAVAYIIMLLGELVYIDEPLVYYRQHGGNVVGAGKGKNIYEVISDLKSVVAPKVKRIYEVFIVSKSLNLNMIGPLYWVNKIMCGKKLLLPIYIYKIRKYLFSSNPGVKMILFLIFGSSQIKSYRKILNR